MVRKVQPVRVVGVMEVSEQEEQQQDSMKLYRPRGWFCDFVVLLRNKYAYAYEMVYMKY